MSKTKELRDSFLQELKNTSEEITSLSQRIQQLNVKAEQLKGAVYALDQALVSQDSETKEVKEQEEVQVRRSKNGKA